MSFDTRTNGNTGLLRRFGGVLTMMLLCCFAYSAQADSIKKGSADEKIIEENPFIPNSWENNIYVPSLLGTFSIVSSTPVMGAPDEQSDVVLRYTIKNNGDEIVNSIQVPFDLSAQLGGDYVSTGSMTAMTGSGSVFTGSSLALFGGAFDPTFDGIGNIDLFDPTLTLAPDECVSVDVPVRLRANSSGFDLNFTTTAVGQGLGGTPVTAPASSIIVSSGCQSESLACAGRVNISLGEDCTGVVRLNTVFLNGNKNPLRYRVVVYDNGVAIGDTVNDSHVGRELTFRVLDGCFDDRASCWGVVIVENKNIPELVTTYEEYVCGEDFRDLKTVEEVMEEIDMSCSASVSDLRETYSTTGDKCIGYVTQRTISGKVDLGAEGIKNVTLRIDSIREIPLNIMDVSAPLGGPLVTDAIKIACDKAPASGNPSPEFIAAYYNALPATAGSGVAFGYPHINRGFRTDSIITKRDTIIETVVPTNVLIDSVWVLLNVVVKDTQEIDIVTTTTRPNLIPITKGTTCNLQTKCTDIEFESCAGPKTKIKRTWQILDWCNGTISSFDQWILITDEEGPAIKPIDNLEANLLPWECTAQVQLVAEAEDACSGMNTDQWIASAGVIDSNGILKNISVSDNPIMITYTATDNCGNDSTIVFTVTVADRVRPVAVTADEINTSIVYDPIAQRGIAKVTVDAVDLGSHDSDCGPITRCILLDEELQLPLYFRDGSDAVDEDGNQLYQAIQCEYDGIFMDTISEDKGVYEIVEVPYVICKDYVKFCCSQIGTNRVALLVQDQSTLSEDGIGWSNVLVEDKSTTTIQCTTVNVLCGDDLSPEAIGTPTVVYGICGGGELSHVDISDIDGCGEGRVIRQWYIDGELRCEQRINISGAGAFDPLAIKWPKHYDDETVTGVRRECVGDSLVHETEAIKMGASFTCGGDALDTPVWCQSTCSLLAMSHEDLELDADGACRKIVRMWTLIDWCTYRPNGNNSDVDNETFVAYNDEWLEGDYPANLEPGDKCETCEKPSGDIGDVYFRYTDDVDIDGYYNFSQIIKISDDTAPEVDAPTIVSVEIATGAQSKNDDFDDCVGSMDVTAQAVELCGDIVTDPSKLSWVIEVIDDEGTILSTKRATGAAATVNTQAGGINDRHLIKWYVNDGCGNEGYAESLVRFEDTKAPTPVCIRDISTATMNVDGGGVTIWAADFDLGSYDNCGPVKVFFKDENDFSVNSLSFSCDDLRDGIGTIRELRMYVADDYGNEDFCFVTLRIDDNEDVCPNDSTAVGNAAISGLVMTNKGDMVENARVRLSVGAEDYTDVKGEYAFRNNSLFNSYKLIGEKNDDPLNGVTTLDLVMIQRHILAVKRFEDSHQIIAGDVSGDGRISSIDLVQLRGVILGRFESFPTNESWRLLNPVQSWSNPLVPFPFVEEVVIEELTADMSEQNFVAVKIGDVSGNAVANSLIAGGRSASRLGLSTTDTYLNAGQQMTVSLTVDQAASLVGYQMTLEADGAVITAVTSSTEMIGDADSEIIDDATATVTWYNTDAVAADGAIVDVTLRATEAGYLSEILHLTNNVTQAVAYDESLEEMTLSLAFDGDQRVDLEGEFSLQQNNPNPFADATIIGFSLPKAGEVTFTVSDMTGRVVKRTVGNYNQGYNEIDLSRKDLSAAGLYYYEVRSGVYSDTRKLIVIE